MEFTVVGAIAVVLTSSLLFCKSERIAMGLIISTIFGTTAVFTISALGGASPLVAQWCLIVFCVGVLRDQAARAALVAVLVRSSVVKWALVFGAVLVVSAVVNPRLFEGGTMTYALRNQAAYSVAVPLSPSTTNLTQALYNVGDVFAFIFMVAFLQESGRLDILHRAFKLAAIVHIGSGVIGLMSPLFGVPDVLDVFRTATYAMLTSTEILPGLRRATGLYSEASAYAFMSIFYFAYFFSYWYSAARAAAEGALSVAFLIVLVVSTSSTAYVFLGIATFAVSLTLCVQVFGGRMTRKLFIVLLVVFGGMIVVTSLWLMVPGSFAPVEAIWNEMVLGKLQSQSGIERSTWNQQALSNFMDTYGIGVGIGSSRTSSWILSLASNLGVPGLVAFGGFLVALLRSPNSMATEKIRHQIVRQSAKWACLAGICAASLSGGSIDLGILFYVFAAVAASLSAERPLVYAGAAGYLRGASQVLSRR